MSGSFRFLEEIAVADAAFEAVADSPSELFTAAAQAVIETMVQPSTVGDSWRCVVQRDDAELSDLLFDWLAEIVYRKDAEAVVFNCARADVIYDAGRHAWQLKGELIGESIDPDRHELRADVKAVTKHLYDVRQDGSQWRARVVLDI